MNGASPRPDSRCSSRASSSLPVPLSPRISTVADSFATFCTRSTMSRICRLGPIRNSRSLCSATCALSVITWRFRSWRSQALRTSERSSS